VNLTTQPSKDLCRRSPREHLQSGCTQESGFNFTGAISTKNQITAAGYTYDAAGNLIADGTHTYTYDAENRLIKVDGGNTSTYVYDGEGHRFSKTNSSSINSGGDVPDPAGTTEFVYDPQGHLVHTESPNGGTQWRGEVFAGNRHLASYANGNLIFAHSDWLGTERNRDLPDPNNPQYPSNQNITSLPFGDWLDNTQAIPVNDWTPLNFTGQYHDFETDLDYFGARYYASTTGRFTSADPDNAGASIDNPQSWNAYSYVLNNPLNAIDPDGLDCVYLNDAGTGIDGPNGIDRWSTSGECRDNGGTWFDATINSNSILTDPKSDWVFAEGVGEATIGNSQYSCGGSDCDQGALSAFANSIAGGSSSTTVTDTSDMLSTDANTIFGDVYRRARIIESGPIWGACTAVGAVLGVPPSAQAPATHILTEAAAKGLENPKTATLAARAYHTTTDARFTAGGKFSKVLVPRTAKALHPILGATGKIISVAGWGLLAYDAYAAGKECNHR
jgi:RHS repeat-associated protein